MITDQLIERWLERVELPMKPHDKIKKLKAQRDILRTENNRLNLEICRLKNRLDVAASKEIALLDQLIMITNKRAS
jgi:regulator of replication initiation timing